MGNWSVTSRGLPTMVGFMVFNATFSYIMAVSFIDGGNRSIRGERRRDLFPVIDKLYHIMLYRLSSGIRTHNVSGIWVLIT